MKKKSLLLAIAAMSMAAVGVGTVGTFAWYQSTQVNNAAKGIIAGTQVVSGETPSAASEQNLYLKLTISLANSSLDLTTMDGQSQGITSEGKHVWYTPDHAYLGVSLTANSAEAGDAVEGSKYAWQWFKNEACTEDATDAEVANLQAGTLDVKASGASRVRVTTKNPSEQAGTGGTNVGEGLSDAALTNSKKFYDAFTGTLNAQDVKIGELSIAAGGAVSGTLAFFYSIAGETPDHIRHDCTATAYESTIAAANLTVTFTMTAHS